MADDGISTRTRRILAAVTAAGLVLAGLGTATAAQADEAPAVSIDLSTYTPGYQTPYQTDGWYYQTGATKADFGIVDTDEYPESGLAGNALQYSNAIAVSGRQLGAPVVNPDDNALTPVNVAGIGTAYNSFTASFAVASATGGLQPGLNVEVSLDGGKGHPYERTGGTLYLRHIPEGLQVTWMWIEYGTADGWRTDSAIIPADEVHEFSITETFVPDGTDVVKVFVDGGDDPLVAGSSWRGYYSAPNTVRNPVPSVGSLMFRGSTSAPTVLSGPGTGFEAQPPLTPDQVEALTGNGLLFTDIAYSVYNAPLAVSGSLTLGVPVVGSAVQVILPAITPQPDEYAYEWFRNGEESPFSTDEAFTPTADDLGDAITLEVTVSRDGFAPITLAAGPQTVVADFAQAPTAVALTAANVGSATIATIQGSWNPAPDAVAYEWYTGGESPAAITATPSYTPTAADLGKQLTVSVVGSKQFHISTRTTSAATPIGLGTLPAGTPTISGTPAIGATLTATLPATWASLGGVSAKSVQWFANGEAIAGASGASYKVAAALGGQSLTVRITGQKAGYTERLSDLSAARTVPKGTLKATGTKITGTAKVGSTLKVTAGSWKPSSAKKSIQWYRGASKITGATKSSYKLIPADAGKTISVRVTGTLTGYGTLAVSKSASKKVATGTLTTKTPTIVGNAKVGRTLTAKPGSWGPSGTKVTFKYQWLRNGASIKGATKATYTPIAIDRGKRISVKVTGSANGYTTASKTSVSRKAG
jgi:hypothetical protein